MHFLARQTDLWAFFRAVNVDGLELSQIWSIRVSNLPLMISDNSATTQYLKKIQSVCIHNRLQATFNNQHITQKSNNDWVMAFTVLGGLELSSTLGTRNVWRLVMQKQSTTWDVSTFSAKTIPVVVVKTRPEDPWHKEVSGLPRARSIEEGSMVP